MATARSDGSGAVVRRRKYQPHEVEAGLLALVMSGGSSHAAAQTTGLPQQTLHSWLSMHRERLEVLRVERGPQLERMAIEGFRAFVVRAEAVKTAALELTMEQIQSGKVKDPAAALKSVAIAQAIGVQRMLELDGRPSGVKPERSAGELLGVLERMGILRTVEGTAVELEPTSELGNGSDDSKDGKDLQQRDEPSDALA